MKDQILFIQKELQKRKLYTGKIDGLMGPKTSTALDKIKELPAAWSTSRKVTGLIQLTAKENKIDAGPVDGYWGPQTDYAFGALKYLIESGNAKPLWRPDVLAPGHNPNKWPSQNPEKNLVDFYGKVGENQMMLQLPYPHKLAWNKRQSITKFSCHKKVHDSMSRVLTNVFKHYGIEEIKKLRLDIFGGCLNVRQMRGGSRYSTHSWAIAVDYDPANNRLEWGKDKASFSKPEYDPWWHFWEEEGWVSLGRARNFDWMHVQAAKLDRQDSISKTY